MNIGKLFGVLVVGGALLTTGAGCSEDGEPKTPDARAVNAPAGDGGSEATADGAPGGDGAAELQECGFCPNECCVTDENGNSAPKEGFVCCWGTSC